MAVADFKPDPFSLELKVEAAGPFETARTIGRIEPGVNLLKAPNGAGKTTLMRILGLFAKQKLAVGDLEVNDQCTESVARVTFGGATMSARIGRVPARSGHEALPAIEGLPEPILSLETGDHRKGDAAAFRARLAALLKWVGIEAVDELRAELAGGDPKLRAWAKTEGVEFDDLIEYATKLRTFAHKCRREREEAKAELEKGLASLEGKRDAILATAGVAEETLDGLPPADEAREEYSRTRDALRTAESRRQAGLEEAERREKLRSTLGERPDTEVAQAESEDAAKAVSEAEAEEKRIAAEVAELRERLSVREHALANAQQAVAGQRGQAEQAAERYRKAVSDQQRHDEMVANLEQPLEYPSIETIERLSAEHSAADERMKAVRISEQVMAVRSQMAKQDELIEREGDAIAHWEDEAAAVWIRLADIVNRELDTDRVRVSGECIEINVSGRWFDIADPARVSEGQRTDACYDLLLQHRRGQRIVVIEGATTVDPQRLTRLGERARARGIALVMETPDADEGEFELVHFPNGEAA